MKVHAYVVFLSFALYFIISGKHFIDILDYLASKILVIIFKFILLVFFFISEQFTYFFLIYLRFKYFPPTIKA